MKHAQYPTSRQLFFIWCVLIGATAMTMIAGKVTGLSSIGLIWAGVLLAVTWLKAKLILSYFLDLKSSTGGWNNVFTALISVIVVVVFSLYVGSTIFTGKI